MSVIYKLANRIIVVPPGMDRGRLIDIVMQDWVSGHVAFHRLDKPFVDGELQDPWTLEYPNLVPCDMDSLPVENNNPHRDIRDARRWRALLASGRLRWLGSAGFDHDSTTVSELTTATAREGEDLHFGMEFWTDYGDVEGKWIELFAREKQHSTSVLTAYVDEIIRKEEG